MADKENQSARINDIQKPHLWGWPTFLSLSVTAVILMCLAMTLDLEDIWSQITAADKRYLLLGALAHYATYLLRGFRWSRCLNRFPIRGGVGKFGLLVFFYNFVDNLVPAKLGDVYAAHLARINFGVRRSAAMGSIVFLRMVDAWIVLILASAASWVLFSAKLPRSIFWSLVVGSIIAVGATSIILIFFLLKKMLPKWIPEKPREMIRAFQIGMWPKAHELLPIAAVTLVIWCLETMWIFFLTLAFGMHVNFSEIIFLTMIPLLASAFPFTPSGAGVVELTLFSCLRVVGVSSPLAASVTVVNRFIDYWLHIGLGLATWALRRVVGLRTWREMPLEMGDSPNLQIKREVFNGG